MTEPVDFNDLLRRDRADAAAARAARVFGTPLTEEPDAAGPDPDPDPAA